MKKAIKLSIFLLLLGTLVFSGCKQKTDATPTEQVTDPDVTDNVGDPNTNAPTDSQNTKQQFLDYILSVDPSADVSAIASSIMDDVISIGDSSIVDPPMDYENLYTTCYVYVSDEGILLDDVVMIPNTGDDTEPFTYENGNPEKVLYEVDDSAVFYTYVITEEWFYYSAPIDSLDTYFETTQNNLFKVYIEDGVVKSMYEVYLS